jgi:hypothetical protein
MRNKQMDAKTAALVKEWEATLSPKERQLHQLAAVKLKKVIVPSDMKNDKDNGSYYPEKSRAFTTWLAAKSKASGGATAK